MYNWVDKLLLIQTITNTKHLTEQQNMNKNNCNWFQFNETCQRWPRWYWGCLHYHKTPKNSDTQKFAVITLNLTNTDFPRSNAYKWCSMNANSVDPYQTAALGEVWSGSTLFAKVLRIITVTKIDIEGVCIIKCNFTEKREYTTGREYLYPS